jgi:hypothetical protein
MPLDAPDTIIPLEIPPGFLLTKTPNAGKGRFTGGNHCRFVGKMPEKWKGWRQFIDEALVGVPRGAVSWTNVDGNINVAIGTHLKLYAITGDDTLTDITPIRATSTINTDPFAVVNGQTLVTVTDTTHEAEAGDFVTFSGATAGGGITIDGEYQIVERIDINTYTINHTSAATSTDSTTGGAAVVAEYQINTGTAGTVYGLGWSAGPWSASTWSTPRTEGITIEGRYWSLSEYGADLLASPSKGGLYLWEEGTDDQAEVVAGAPTSIRFMFVTGERFVFALGTTTPMTVQWPDVDDMTDWTPALGNTANSRTLQSGGRLVGGCPLTDGVNLVWSDTSLYLFQKIESDFIYDSRLVGTNCGLLAAGAFCRVSGVAFWMSGQQVYMYVQGIQQIPQFEDIRAFVFDDMDPQQISKIWCLYDQKNNQVRWGYCSRGATEPDKYFDVNLDGTWAWTVGTLDRTTGCIHRPADASTLMADADGVLWSHDTGLNDGDSALAFELSYGLYTLTRGETNVDVTGLIFDHERQSGALSYLIFTKDRPESSGNQDTQTLNVNVGDTLGELRVAGRHFGMTISQNLFDGDFRGGIPALMLGPDGERL